ncbi:MAG: dual specificity protein phosphatase family protein [Chloroflexota bacterium]|jgi:atypical dual specificity phosphatase|nr:dual specificity protein phosphatase family protein [Chloroflexota bacterium]MDP6507594.1 dual specificity protein phosphatase family protein [Chloroflexota bacterium]MDP6757382.1 dual specificity protein phosphatase family protein [Chloroflexota bacterium]
MRSSIPKPPPIDHFWLIPGHLAGGGHPGRVGSQGDVLHAMERLGYDAILTLTEDALEPEPLAEFGFQYLHLPIVNMDAPSIEQGEQAVAFLRERIDAGGQAYVHCYAGYGRTGAILAAYLVATGTAPFTAIQQLRTVRPGAIESAAQERFVLYFARHLRNGE